MAPLLPSYLRRYPGVSLEASLSDRVPRPIDDGFDLAIRAGRLADSTLIARRLQPLRRHVVASPDYLDCRGVPQSPSDLARHDCLTLLSGSGRTEWEFLVGDRREILCPAGGIQTDSLWLLRHAAVDGLGLARLADFIVEDDIRTGRLVPVLTGLEVTDEAIHAVYPATRHVSPKVRSFIEHLLAGPSGQGATAYPSAPADTGHDADDRRSDLARAWCSPAPRPDTIDGKPTREIGQSPRTGRIARRLSLGRRGLKRYQRRRDRRYSPSCDCFAGLRC